jgi:adenine-specific DNA-methyltransferase
MPPRTESKRRQQRFALGNEDVEIAQSFSASNTVTLFEGDCVDLLASMPDQSAQLVVTSPPYNIGKEYERRRKLDEYIRLQSAVIAQAVRILNDDGSICWQVGNYVADGAIIPLDLLLYPVFAQHGLQLRNRIVWHFEHGLHCSKRFSGRYETILWFTKTEEYHFDVDPIRVPQKYPGKKYFKGPRAGEYSCNPNGKNPGDVWIIPNVKHNHVEKTPHPCQFPVELIERLVLSMTRPDGLVVDPFLGAGTSAIAALRHGRRAAGAEIVREYCDLARERILLEARGELRTRPMHKDVYQPSGTITVRPF